MPVPPPLWNVIVAGKQGEHNSCSVPNGYSRLQPQTVWQTNAWAARSRHLVAGRWRRAAKEIAPLPTACEGGLAQLDVLKQVAADARVVRRWSPSRTTRAEAKDGSGWAASAGGRAGSSTALTSAGAARVADIRYHLLDLLIPRWH